MKLLLCIVWAAATATTAADDGAVALGADGADDFGIHILPSDIASAADRRRRLQEEGETKLSLAFLRVSNSAQWNHEGSWTAWASRCHHAKLYHVKSAHIERFSSTMVEAMVELFHAARSEFDYDYFHFFSDSCLPITSCKLVEQHLLIHAPKSFIGYPISPQWITLHRSFKPFMTKELYKPFECTGSSCEAIRKKPGFKAPDEVAFGKVIVRKGLQNMTTGSVLTYVNWELRQGGHPGIFHTEDQWRRFSPAKYYFARKFSKTWVASPDGKLTTT